MWPGAQLRGWDGPHPTRDERAPWPLLDPRPTRRQFLIAMGVGLIGAACSRAGGRTVAGAPGSIDALTSGKTPLSVLGTGTDALPMNPGTNRLGFALVTSAGGLVHGGSPEMWIAKDSRTRALGPFPATWHPFTGYDKTGDRSPKSPLPGAYAAEIDFPSAGAWDLVVTVADSSGGLAGKGIVQITASPVVAGLGSKAIPTSTPVATTARKLKEVCTRVPPDPMHYLSLDVALRSAKPTVVVFSTPLLCESQLCGPVTDEVLLVFETVGSRRANFIHVEEYPPGTSAAAPLPENRAPAFKAWGLESEPWVFVIDRTGLITFRSLGPVTASEISAALQPLL
jgi:hypothetical protein